MPSDGGCQLNATLEAEKFDRCMPPKKTAPTQSLAKTRFSFFVVEQYKQRISSVLDEGRAIGALPMSCDDMSAFINEAIGRELAHVEAAISDHKKPARGKSASRD